MRTGLRGFVGIALAAMLVVALSAREGFGIWNHLLVEYFDKNQENQPEKWPWGTPPQNPNIRWHYNPRPPYYRPDPIATDFTWGVQGERYSSYIRQREEFPQSIWCAWTNRSDINHPHSPIADNYQHNQNAWAWWGPFSTRNAVGAGVSFWYYLDVQYGMQDSFCVVVVNNPNNLTVSSSRDMRTLPAYGVCVNDTGGKQLTVFNHDEADWRRREFYLDSLRLLDANGRIHDTISYLNEPELYLAFVWQSNATGIDVRNGKGAFVDDVFVMYDDGLFELQPDYMQFGYPIDEENIDWNSNLPRNNNDVRFRLRWRADGVGEVGPLDIVMLLDNQEIYRETRTVIARPDTVYVTTADTLWHVTAGEHVVRWVVDAPSQEHGQVQESNENNNEAMRTFIVEWNPPPEFFITTPATDSTQALVSDTAFHFNFFLSDSNLTDEIFSVYLYWTEDITGLEENPDLIYDYHYIAHTFEAVRGESVLKWNLKRAFENGEIDTSQVIYICGFANDGFLDNMTVAVAPGRLWTRPPPNKVEGENSVSPNVFGMSKAFPNPFNRSVMIEYTLEQAGVVNLSVFDLNGRQVATLVKGQKAPGRYLMNWSPSDIGAGVYLARLESAGKTSMQKIIYTP